MRFPNVLLGVVTAAVIVGADLLFFRDRAGDRLIANVVIASALGAIYLLLLRRH